MPAPDSPNFDLSSPEFMSNDKLEEELAWLKSNAAELQRDLESEGGGTPNIQERFEKFEDEIEKLEDEQERRRAANPLRYHDKSTVVQPLAATDVNAANSPAAGNTRIPSSEPHFTELLDHDLGLFPDEISGLRKYIADVEMIFNSRDDQLSGPWSEEERKELLKRHAEATSRLEELNANSDYDENRESVPLVQQGDSGSEQDQKLLQDIAKLWRQIGVTPSYAVANALEFTIFATREAPMAITPWQILLGLIRDGERVEKISQNSNDLALQLLLIRRLRIRQGNLARLWRSTVNYESGSVNTQQRLSPSLRAILKRAAVISSRCSPGQLYVAARHFVAALMEHFLSGNEEELKPLKLQDLRDCLEEHLPFYSHEDIRESWDDLLAELQKPRIRSSKGLFSVVRREAAPDELCLGIDDYSSAIKEVFQNAAPNNDFVFGLFAPWGRGKSTLMSQVAEKLLDTHEIVKFGAAKYPSRPEVWVHLYQTIADAAMAPGFWAKWRLRIRIGLLRTGWLPLFFGFFAASFSAFVWMGWVAEALLWLFHGIGLLGVLILIGYVYRFFGLGKLIHALYGQIPDHSDKLGLQAVIGDDLERLLRAWFPSRSHPDLWSDMKFWTGNWWSRLIDHFANDDGAVDFRIGRYGWLAVSLCLVLVGAGCCLGAHSSLKWIIQHNAPDGTITMWNCAAVVPFVAIFVFSVFSACQIACGAADSKRSLLIVDDLDRCDPEQSLSVVESIRWFLDTPSVSSRLHVAMLMERTALEAACKQRAKGAEMLPPEDEWTTRFRAHREKLFVVELSLPSLLNAEVEDLVTLAVEREDQIASEKVLRGQLAKHIAATPKPRKETRTKVVDAPYTFEGGAVLPPVSRKSTFTEVITPTSDENAKHESERLRLVRELEVLRKPITQPTGVDEEPEISKVLGFFSQAEQEAIKSAFRLLSPELITPRSVRATVIRYQFARRLLKNVDFEPSDLIERLLQHMFDPSLEVNTTVSNAPQLDRVVAQIV